LLVAGSAGYTVVKTEVFIIKEYPA